MKINFDRVEVFTGIAKKHCMVENIREQFADLVYMTGRGIAAHALAMKIYNGNAETEYNDEECAMIRQFAENCTPSVIDAIRGILDAQG